MSSVFNKSTWSFIFGVTLMFGGLSTLKRVHDYGGELSSHIISVVGGVLCFVLGSVFVAPVLVRLLVDRISDGFNNQAPLTEPPEQMYHNFDKAIELKEYDRAKMLLMGCIDAYPKEIRPYYEAVDHLKIEDAQMVMKQAKRKLGSDDYQKLVEILWDRKKDEAKDAEEAEKQRKAREQEVTKAYSKEAAKDLKDSKDIKKPEEAKPKESKDSKESKASESKDTDPKKPKDSEEKAKEAKKDESKDSKSKDSTKSDS